MLQRTSRATSITTIAVAMCLLVALPSVGQIQTDTDSNGIGPIIKINQEVNHARSIAVRDMPTIGSLGSHVSREAEPARRIPLPAGVNIPDFQDPVLQHTTAGLAPTLAAPTASGVNVDGLGNASLGFTVNSAPPDTNGAVGATQYVQWVNSSFAVFNKTTGAKVSGPTAGNTLFSSLGNGCATNNDGDPVALYDKLASRWVLSQFSVSTTPFLQCIAVSTTSDATGTYNVYSFSYPNFDDYPKMGLWPDGYYQTFNMFNGNTFVGADACAYDRNKMLAGQAATQVCFQQGSSVGGLLPADLDGTTAPPAGEPNFLVFFGSNNLNLFKFHVDFATPANSTFTGPTVIPVAAFSTLCGGGTCIPQSGTTTQLDSLADRLMFRLAYRNLGTKEALVVSHSVVAGSSGGIRWYEIDNPNGTPVVAQQSTFAPDAKFRWMGSIAMDHNGNMGLGYSVSSSTSNPSIAVTGRLATDPANTMQAETTVVAGTGSQTGNLSRWGDYSAMTVDPVDDCTFWYTTEYMKTTGSFNWNTRIANFKFSGCGAATPDFSLAASPASLTVNQGASGNSTISVTDLNGFTGSVTLSASGLPSGVTASFGTNPTTGSSVLTLTASATATTGAATVTVTGVSGSLTHTTTVALTVNAVATPNFSLSASPASLTITQGTSGSSTITVTPSGGFTGSVTLSNSALPAGVTAAFGTNPTTGTSSLTFTASATATTGTSTVTITGTSGTLSHTTSISLTVNAVATPDFSVSASPVSLTVKQGTSGSSTITVTPSGGFTGSVTLSNSTLPAGVTAAIGTNPTTGTSVLTFTASATATTGASTITVTGTSGTLTHTTTISLTISSAAATQLIVNPGFENGTNTAPWTLTAGVINNSSSEPPHSGSWDAWLDGYGTSHTDSAAQTVTIPSTATTATLTFWLHIDTAETTTTTAFDTLKVQVISGGVTTTLGTFSNLNKAAGYIQRSFNVTSFIGQTVQIKFLGVEDTSLQTSFVIDDVNLNVQ